MGTKYSTQTVSGYNASPPSDDGSLTDANKVKWSTIKAKLADPLNATIEDINDALVAALNYSARQITANDSTVAGDHMRTVEVASNVSSAVTVSLGDAATMGSGYITTIKNSGSATVTVARLNGGDTLDGVASNTVVYPGESLTVLVNSGASGYLTVGRSGGQVRGAFTAAFATGTSGTITINPSFNTGTYQRNGGWVDVCGRFTVSAVSSPVGVLSLTGLPYASANVDRAGVGVSVLATGLSSGNNIVGHIAPNTSQIDFYDFNAGSITNMASYMQTGAALWVQARYPIF